MMKYRLSIWSRFCATSRRRSSPTSCKVFFKNQLPYKSVNLAFAITNIKNELTNLCGNCILQVLRDIPTQIESNFVRFHHLGGNFYQSLFTLGP